MKQNLKTIGCLIASVMLAVSEGEKSPPYYEGYDKQELLSGSALVALRDQNTQLLEALKANGWDSSIPLGRMPDGEIISTTPATYSALCGLEKSLSWLLGTNGKCRLERDGYFRRPIDLAIEQLSEGLEDYPEDVIKHEAIIKMLERDGKPVESEAIEELARYASSKFGGSASLKVHLVNGKVPGESWKNFDSYVAQLSALRESVDSEKKEPVADPEKVRTTKLNFDWKLVDEKTYRFVISENSDDGWGGGGVKGDLRIKHGYWIAENVSFWDS